jgi:predicted  nucleic acid-binding Zn-ribbon protein
MKRPVLVALIAAIVLLGGASAYLYQKNQNTTAAYTDMKSAEESARSQYADAFNAIAEIQDSLNAIGVRGTSMEMRQNLQSEQKLRAPNRQEALESIARLNESIQRTKEKITDLESHLHKNGVKIAGLQKMIANLKSTVAGKEQLIGELTGRVDSLQTQVAGLETTVAQDQETIVAKDQTIEEKRKELGTIYYISGTKKDLANSGVIEAKGGVLGLGKTVTLSGQYDESRFTALDTDQETVIRAPASKLDKVKILSAQPKSSYQLVMAGNEVEIHIIDPKEFRKVKHLVIMTA